jgi:hypothetical protein
MNADETRMSEWLAHPMEFGEPPVEMKEIHREMTPWPLEDSNVEIVFLGDGVLDGLSNEEMKRAFAGCVSLLANSAAPLKSSSRPIASCRASTLPARNS